jgi:GNAT superfamily N-acetyltransferase
VKPHVRRATVADAERINDVRIGGWKAAYADAVPQAYLDALDPRADDERRRGHLADPLPGVVHWVSEAGGDDGKLVVGWASTGPVRAPGETPASGSEAADGEGKHPAGREHDLEVWALYVHPDHWRQGHGAALLRAVSVDARARGFTALVLWALAQNPVGRTFYEKEGFRVVPGEQALSVGGAELAEVRYRLELSR